MLVDQQKAVELALAKLGYTLRHGRIEMVAGRLICPPVILAMCYITLHQHERPFTAKDEIKQKPPRFFASTWSI